MKHLIFIKPTAHIQIGHLYEHLYCHQLAQAFKDNGLFAYVDYSIDAKTYYDGYVRLEVHLYTQEAIKNEALIYSLTPIVNQDSISGGLLQIMAEKYADVQEIDYDVVSNALAKLSKQDWQPIESLGIKSYSSEPKTEKGLVLTSRSQRQFLNLTLTIALNLKDTKLETSASKALFVVIAKALRENLLEIIADNSYCYSVSDTFTGHKRTTLKDSNIFRIDKRQATAITSELYITRQFLNSLAPNGFVERLSEFLQTSKISVPYGLPGDNEISEKVAVLIGEQGWREIGTVKNIQEILQNITITYKLGKDTETLLLK